MVKIEKITINLGFLTVEFREDELDSTLSALVNEMRQITRGLAPDERAVLRAIMGGTAPTTVGSVFPEFTRNSAPHETLRKLRDAQFIRPAGGGPWAKEKSIEVKQFGRLMWEKIGETRLFEST